VAGPAPARWQQFEEIDGALAIVEAGTVALIALVVGLTFRSVGAPLLVLFVSGIAFLISSRLVPWVGDALEASVPQEVEPLVVALTLGIATDYSVFFLAACRRRLASGEERVEAAKRSAPNVAPIVATAGLIVVAGTAALLAGELEFFRAFGPSLALTAAVALAVSLTPSPRAWRSSDASSSGRVFSRAKVVPAGTTGHHRHATRWPASSPRRRSPRSSRSSASASSSSPQRGSRAPRSRSA
jgi:RND superfamily putative drug exporter